MNEIEGLYSKITFRFSLFDGQIGYLGVSDLPFSNQKFEA